MSWRQSFVAFIGAIALAFGFAAPSMAQTTDTVSVNLAGGVVSFSIDVTTSISPLAYNHGTGYTNGTGGAFTIAVQDDRNTSAGYTINLAASHFTRASGTGSIILGVGVDEAKLAVPTAGTVARVAGDFANLPTARTATSLTSTAVPILTAAAGFGNGHYTATGYALTLTGVSAAVPSGLYTSTLTLTSPAGPT